MSCPSHDLTAVVIGGGPAGLTASLGLRHICSRVFVLEKHPSFDDTRGATFGIAPNGRKALMEIDPELWSELESVGIQAFALGGGLVLPWWEMRSAIARVVQRVDNIKLHMGESFNSIVENEDGVMVKCESGLELQGDFLVAADGVRSDVRAWLGLPPGLESDSRVYRGFVTVNEQSSSELQRLLEKGVIPLGARELKGSYFVVFNFNERYPGRLVWVLSTTRPIDENSTPMKILLESELSEADVPLIRELFDLSAADSLKPYPTARIMDFNDETLSLFPQGGWGGRGRITLVGDAAHGMRPTDGQGGNQAFEDAVVLSRTLRQLESKQGLSKALRDFEAERLPRVKRIYENQRDRYEKRMQGEPIGPIDPEFQEWIQNGV